MTFRKLVWGQKPHLFSIIPKWQVQELSTWCLQANNQALKGWPQNLKLMAKQNMSGGGESNTAFPPHGRRPRATIQYQVTENKKSPLLTGGPHLSILLDLIHAFRQIWSSLQVERNSLKYSMWAKVFFSCDSLKSLKFNFMIMFTNDNYSQTDRLFAENSQCFHNERLPFIFWKLEVSIFVLFMVLSAGHFKRESAIPRALEHS